MALSKATYELEHLVTCGICLEQFTDRDPRALSCLHSFCLSCLESTYHTKVAADPSMEGFLVCPTCTERTSLPDGFVEKLRPYFVAEQVSNVLEQLSQQQQEGSAVISESMPQCGRCRKGLIAVGYCFDCVQPMCSGCFERHANKQHVSIPVTSENINSVICPSHQEYAEDFCLQCGTIACGTCHHTTHIEHEFRAFCLAIEDKETVTKAMDDIKNRNDSALNGFLKLQSSATKHTEQQEQLIDDIFAVLLKSMTDDVLKMKSDLQKQKFRVDSMVSKGEKLNKTLGALIKSAIEPLADISQVSLKGIDKAELRRLEISPMTEQAAYTRLIFEAGPSIIVGTLILSTPIATYKPQLIRSLNSTFVRDIDFLPDGKIVTVHTDSKIHLYNHQLESIKFPVSGVELTNVKKIAADDNNHLIAVNLDFLMKIAVTEVTWTSDKINTKTRPWAVAVSRDDHIVFGDNGGKALTKCTISGDVVWKKQMKHGLEYITVANDGKIIITTNGNPFTTHVYNSTGDPLYKLPRPGDDDKLLNPQGTCTDCMGNMYISDSERKVVCMFDTEGRYIKDIITGLKVDGGRWLDMSLYQDRLLAIGSSTSVGFIKLYSFDG